MQDTIDMTANSAGGTIPPVEEQDTTTDTVMTSCSAWIEEGRPVNCDASGLSYKLLGPDSYKEYMKKVQDGASGIVDITSKHRVMMLGHNPGMEILASTISQCAIEMPTGAIGVLDSNSRDEGWPSDWTNSKMWKWRGLVKPREIGT
jgi:hypothetical protein